MTQFQHSLDRLLPGTEGLQPLQLSVVSKSWPFLDMHFGNMKCDFPCSVKPEPTQAGLISLLSPVFVLRKSKHGLFLLSSKEGENDAGFCKRRGDCGPG